MCSSDLRSRRSLRFGGWRQARSGPCGSPGDAKHRPETALRVGATTHRKILPGPEGVRILALGGVHAGITIHRAARDVAGEVGGEIARGIAVGQAIAIAQASGVFDVAGIGHRVIGQRRAVAFDEAADPVSRFAHCRVAILVKMAGVDPGDVGFGPRLVAGPTIQLQLLRQCLRPFERAPVAK